jgi:hypothetical protein
MVRPYLQFNMSFAGPPDAMLQERSNLTPAQVRADLSCSPHSREAQRRGCGVIDALAVVKEPAK